MGGGTYSGLRRRTRGRRGSHIARFGWASARALVVVASCSAPAVQARSSSVLLPVLSSFHNFIRGPPPSLLRHSFWPAVIGWTSAPSSALGAILSHSSPTRAAQAVILGD